LRSPSIKLSHIPNLGTFHRLVVGVTSLGWETDIAIRIGDLVVRFVSGQIHGERVQPMDTIERKDVGITLRMTPHIHESDFVNLDIYQESSAILGTSILNVSQVGPTTTKRSAKTSVLVRNGDTVVMGGMMQDTFSVLESQIPLLGDIPLLGNLFKFKSVSRQKTNLLIFLTPHIIKQAEDISRVTKDQQKKMDAFIEENRGEVESILPEKKVK